MIKIIKEGTRNLIECNNCGAILSYEIEDIKESEHFITQRQSYFKKYIICPQCRASIVLESEK